MGTDEHIKDLSHYYPEKTTEYGRMVLGKWEHLPSTIRLMALDHTEAMREKAPMIERESKFHVFMEHLRTSTKGLKASEEVKVSIVDLTSLLVHDVLCEYDVFKSEKADLLECLFKMQEEIDDKTQALKDVVYKVESDTHGLKGVVLTAEVTEDVHDLCNEILKGWDDK